MSSRPDLFFDFVVLGGGSAGYAAARTYHAAGAGTVAVIDGAPELGGLCILRGCMPSKTLIASADLLQRTREAAAYGLVIEGARADLALLRARKHRLISDFASYRQGQLADGRFTLLRHRGTLTGPHSLRLDDGRTVRFKHLMIATGSVIATPGIPGLADTPHWTSDDVLDLPDLPESVIVLGGGIVACELAQCLHRLGVTTTIIQRSPRILRDFSPEASATVTAAFDSEGMTVHTGTRITAIRPLPDGGVEVAYDHEGQPRTARAARLFQALGRRPATDGLGLEHAGVKVSPSGHIVTDAAQRTSQPHIVAAGDCTGPLETVHVAIRQAETAVASLLGIPVRPVDYDRELQVVFTDPGVAFCGRREEALRAAGVDFATADYPFADHGKALVLEAPHGFVRVWAERATGRLLAAECTGRDAAELIHPLAVGVALDLTAADLLRVPWYHPTLAEIWTYPLEDLAVPG